MEDTAFGELGLRPKQFGNLTPNAFFKMVRGYYRKLEDKYWEPARWLGALHVNMNIGPEDQPWQPQDLLPLRKDVKIPEPPQMTPEELKAWVAEIEKLDADLIRDEDGDLVIKF